MKRVCMLLMVLVLGFGITACGIAAQDDPVSADKNEDIAAAGVWEIFAADPIPLPDDVQAAFDKMSETLTGAELIPVAYGWQQQVAGTNYMVLCRQNPSTEELVEGAGEYQMVVLYADLSGNAEIRSMTPFEIADYTEEDGPDVAGEELTGGWAIAEDYTKTPMPEEAQAAFDQATEKLLGNDLTPMALLGMKTEEGTSYAILCHSSLVTPEPVESLQLAVVYVDPEGNALLTNICTLDPADYNQ